MATKKASSSKKSSAASKRTTNNKLGKVMQESKQHELPSGRSGKKVTSRKQAVAIGLSEARRAGANVPAKKKATAKKAAAKKTTAKSTAKKATAKKAVKKSAKKSSR